MVLWDGGYSSYGRVVDILFCTSIIVYMNSMINIKLEALKRIEHLAWEDHTDAEYLLDRIQAVLYEMEQIVDKQSERMHGSDQYPLDDTPKI